MRFKNWKLSLSAGVIVLAGFLSWRLSRTHTSISDSHRLGAANGTVRRTDLDQQKLPNFIGQEACAQCHSKEVILWKKSDHAKSMAHASDSTVLANFNNDSLRHNGILSRFYKQDGKFFVHTEGPSGVLGDFKIQFTFGVHPLQQYLVAFPGGRLQCLPLAWNTKTSHWFHLNGEQNIPSDDWLHWTRSGQNWNGMCADCHSTGLKRNYNAQADTFSTEWKEIDVSCEACHGPGADHAAQAGSSVISKWFTGYGVKNKFGLIVRFADSASHPASPTSQGTHQAITADSKLEVAACARCHARRMALRTDFQYHKNFLDEYVPELLRESIYHPDGQIQDEDYEYGSFLQSKMYQHGVRCSDCHDPHSLRLKGVDNALCTRCHDANVFDRPLHHQHLQGSTGSLCINCHMPTKTYMQFDVRRDHSLRIPRPDQSALYGTPNACTQCHSDKPASWASQWVVKWYGPVRKPHFSDKLILGRSGKLCADTALADLISLANLSSLSENGAHPAIVRATALHLLSEYMNDLSHSALLNGIKDSEPLVRQAAATGLQESSESDRISTLVPLLSDSLLAVRIAAVNGLITASPMLPDSARRPYQSALMESRIALDANAFFPGGRFNLGQLHEKLGNKDSAVLAYSAALKMDNRFIPARINLALLLDRMGRAEEAESHFRACIHFNPEYADAYYFLGLILAGQNKLDSAAQYMKLAGHKLSRNSRIQYNLGLILQKLNRMDEAVTALQNAIAISGEDPEYLYTLAWLYTIIKKWNKAMEVLPRLASVAPQHPGLAGLEKLVSQNHKSEVKK